MVVLHGYHRVNVYFALVVMGPFVTEFAWFFFLKTEIGMPISQSYFEELNEKMYVSF